MPLHRIFKIRVRIAIYPSGINRGGKLTKSR